MAKMIKVPENDWLETRTALSKVKEMQERISALEEGMRELRLRWGKIFPESRRELESSAIAAIQQELGLPRLIEEARNTIQAKARELSDKFIVEVMLDPRWKETIKNIHENLDIENVERQVAELLAEKLKEKIDLPEIAREIADAMLENDDIHIDTIEEEVESRIAEFLEENLSVNLKRGGQ